MELIFILYVGDCNICVLYIYDFPCPILLNPNEQSQHMRTRKLCTSLTIRQWGTELQEMGAQCSTIPSKRKRCITPGRTLTVSVAQRGDRRQARQCSPHTIAVANTKMDSRFACIDAPPLSETVVIRQACADDKHEDKVDLGIGAYRTDEGQPWVLPVVARTEVHMANDKNLNHEYLMLPGLDSFCESATKLLLGTDSDAVRHGRAFGVQALSGEGSMRLGAEFLSRVLNYNIVYISDPSWDNHHKAFVISGMSNTREYRYWDAGSRTLDFPGMLEDLGRAPEDSVVVLHACAHNPTGCDPTREQWTKIADIMQERRLFPFFDCAYQGLASGDVDQDTWAVRHFVERGFELFCAQSFAKNFGLYNERVGNLVIVLRDNKQKENVQLHLFQLIHDMYSNLPHHGVRIVSTILMDPQLCLEWKECIQTMANRTMDMRKLLRERLERLGTPGSWDHITQQVGMFSYTGLSLRQVEFLTREKHIYLMRSGRISMCGLTTKNIDYVANSIHEAVLMFPEQQVVKEQHEQSSCVTL